MSLPLYKPEERKNYPNGNGTGRFIAGLRGDDISCFRTLLRSIRFMDVETALRRPGRLVHKNGNLLRYGPEGHLQKVLQSAVHRNKPK
jgi:hypothetical protein